MNGIQQNKRFESVQNVIVHTGTENERNDFYVYVYLDPRKPGTYKYGGYKFNYEPIYVGKGKSNRIQHLWSEKNKLLKAKTGKFLIPLYIKIKESLTEKEAFELEKELISLIGRIDSKTGPLCNFTNGGEGVAGHIRSLEWRQNQAYVMTGRKASEETKKKMSDYQKSHPHTYHLSEEGRKKLIESLKTRVISKETRKKLSIINKGKKKNLSEEGRRRLSENCTKRFLGTKKGPTSDETKKKISKANKGRKRTSESIKKQVDTVRHKYENGYINPRIGRKSSIETRRKISEAGRLRKHSDETKKKMSEIKIKYWQERNSYGI